MSIKQLTRDNFYSGVYAYAIVEEVILGLATVRLTKNGARLTSLPVIGGQVLIGDTVIVDYSSNIPPVVRPIDEHPYYDEEEFEFALAVPILLDEPLEEEPAVYFKGGDHGAQVSSFGGLILAGDPVYWNQVEYDTDGFYSPLKPWINIPAPGLYYFVADVGWPPVGEAAGHLRPGFWTQGGPPSYVWTWKFELYPLDTPIDLRAEIASADIGTIGDDVVHPIPRTQGNKYHSIIGQAPLLAGDRVALNLTVEGIDGLHLVQEYGLCPRLTVQWLGNINEELA